MPESPDSGELVALVRSALAHLYDYAHLQNHPLATLLDSEKKLDQVSRAQKVRRLLLDCIDGLQPQGNAPAEAARAYAILTYHYVDGLSMPAIASKLSLSQRQVYREHEKGVKAIARLLEDRVGLQSRSSTLVPAAVRDANSGQVRVAQAEVERLRQTVQAESLSLTDILNGVSSLLLPLCQQMGIQIRLSESDSWPPVIADRTMLRQAFLSLLSHALRSVHNDIVIGGSLGAQGLWVEISESSTVRAHVKSSLLSARTEINLAVAQSLIEAQGGQLEINPRPGEWKAKILLPTASQATMLAIDDNAELASLFQRYLGGHQVSVVGTADGEQALRLAAELKPQVIMLDVMMPRQDGWEILQKLKHTPETSHIPIIICSVLNEPQLALSMGASDYITKPVNQDDLLQVLRRWLGPLQVAA